MESPRDEVSGPQKAEGVTRAAASLLESVILIAIALGVGIFLVWIVTVHWVLEIVAWIILMSNVMFGLAVGYCTYRLFEQSIYPKWVRVTVATILGCSIAFTVLELTHSHQLIRDYGHYSSDDDDQ
jgi:uncharacterized membrane protein